LPIFILVLLLPKLLTLKPVFAQLASPYPVFAWAGGPSYAPPDGADETLPVSGEGSSGSIVLPNPLGDIYTLPVLVGHIIRALLGIVGSLALVVFIYGGFVWMSSVGNGDRVDKGKNILAWAVIGLAVIFSAYALVRFVFEGLGITGK
jgi:hypothetical protein